MSWFGITVGDGSLCDIARVLLKSVNGSSQFKIYRSKPDMLIYPAFMLLINHAPQQCKVFRKLVPLGNIQKDRIYSRRRRGMNNE